MILVMFYRNSKSDGSILAQIIDILRICCAPMKIFRTIWNENKLPIFEYILRMICVKNAFKMNWVISEGNQFLIGFVELGSN